MERFSLYIQGCHEYRTEFRQSLLILNFRLNESESHFFLCHTKSGCRILTIRDPHHSVENECSPRRSSYILGVLLVVAFALRAWQSSQMSIEHFDEGVYASNYHSVHLDYRYPDRHLYAPPMFPAILEWTLILTGGNPQAVMWVNVVLGTALVAAIWWITNLIAGAGAALGATALATFSDFLIQYSRVALTDTPVCLFMVLAVGCGLIALRDRNSLAAVGAALLTAAAWWTKYNGWLPLAILGAGLAGWVVFERPKRSEVLPRIGLLVVIAVGAFLFWLPCLWELQEFGGYAAVAKNHSGYLVGFAGWWDSFVRHLLVQRKYSFTLSLGFVAAFFAMQYYREPYSLLWSRQFWVYVFLIFLISAFGGGVLVLLGLTCTGIVELLRFQRRTRKIEAWIILAWIAGLALTTPLYNPYPRLLMPLWISALVAGAIGIDRLVSSLIPDKIPILKAHLIGRIIFLTLCISFTLQGRPNAVYEYRGQLNIASAAILQKVQEITGTAKLFNNVNAIIYVVGEPGLYYHLASREEIGFDYITQPASNLGMLAPKANAPKVPTFLVLGPHAPLEMETLAAQAGQATLIQEIPYQPSDLVLLDDHAPADLEENRDAVIQLWQVLQD